MPFVVTQNPGPQARTVYPPGHPPREDTEWLKRGARPLVTLAWAGALLLVGAALYWFEMHDWPRRPQHFVGIPAVVTVWALWLPILWARYRAFRRDVFAAEHVYPAQLLEAEQQYIRDRGWAQAGAGARTQAADPDHREERSADRDIADGEILEIPAGASIRVLRAFATDDENELCRRLEQRSDTGHFLYRYEIGSEDPAWVLLARGDGGRFAFATPRDLYYVLPRR